MKTYSTQIRVEAEHLDKGDHANWLAQLAIAQEVHFAFRNQLGLGLDEMKEKYNLFLVMANVKDVFYRRQLRLGDVLDVNITMWISRLTSLEFHCLFYKDGKVATEMSWVMPLVSVETERLCKIPQWMIEVIGTEKPEPSRLQPASISN
ncbi:MAG: thioesterase family protein [Patescibacteria group bacterium]